MAGSIIARLKTGISREDMLSPFEPFALPAFVVSIAGFASIAAALWLSTFRIVTIMRSDLILACLAFPVLGFVARRYSMTVASDIMLGIGLLAQISLLMQIGCIFVTPLTFGWSDGVLSSADGLLFFPWRAIVDWFAEHHGALEVSRVLYKLLMVEPALVVMMLAVFRQRIRLWAFINAWAIALVITLVIYIVTPARGPYWLYGVPHEPFRGLMSDLPWQFPVMLEHLRDGSLRTIDHELGTGLVSFPSFHACGAALLGWAAWRLPLLRWPFLLLNLGIGASAIVIGGHYFIDLPGGVAVAALAVTIAQRVMAEPRSAVGRRFRGGIPTVVENGARR